MGLFFSLLLFFFFSSLLFFDLARNSAGSPVLQTRPSLPLKRSRNLTEVIDFQGNGIRGLKRKVKLSKNKNATEEPPFIFKLSLMQKVNTWHKWLMQVCQGGDQTHAEFSSMFCTKFDGVCLGPVARQARTFFYKKMSFKKMWKILLFYLLHVSIVKQSLILF